MDNWIYTDDDDGEVSGFNINGYPITGKIPVGTETPYLSTNDLERFIMSLPYDEGRVLVVRALGLEGKRAAEVGGFKSIWVYIRKLKKLQARMRTQTGIAF